LTASPPASSELGQWYDLAVVFQPGKSISLYRDGQFVKALPLEADLTHVMARDITGNLSPDATPVEVTVYFTSY
jgi:hypothetical protein